MDDDDGTWWNERENTKRSFPWDRVMYDGNDQTKSVDETSTCQSNERAHLIFYPRIVHMCNKDALLLWFNPKLKRFIRQNVSVALDK